MRFDTTLYDYARQNNINYTYSLYDAFDVCKLFEDRYIAKYDKPLNIMDSEWAYWFAKFIINDYWPAGELLICQNQELASAYRVMVSFEITAGILGHSLDGIKPVDQDIVTPRKKSLDDVADMIDQEMQQFRRQAKIRVNELRELL